MEEMPLTLKETVEQSKVEPVTACRVEDQIEHALVSFRLIRDNRLRQVFNLMPLAIVIVMTIRVFAQWYTNRTWAWSYLTGGLALVVSLLITRELFNQFPQTLLTIWKRRLLLLGKKDQTTPASTNRDVNSQFQDFIRTSEDQLNSNLSVGFGLFGMFIVIWFLVSFEPDAIVRLFVNFRSDPFATSLSWTIRLTYLMGGLIGGLVLWRIVVIARRVRALGYDFDLNLQIEHPDACGGLRPIGDLCLVIAFILSPFLLLLSGWLVFLNLDHSTQSGILSVNLRDPVSTLQALVIPLAVVSLVGFFQPLIAMHASMDRAKLRLQDELDSISQQIHQISTDLRANAQRLSPDEAAALEKKIDFLQRVYARNNNIPTWPFNYTHVWRLATTQIAPAIGIVSSVFGTLLPK